MQFAMLLFLCCFFWIQAAHGDVVMTQSPESLFSSIGDNVTIKCQANTDIDDDINWYQQKPGQSPKLLFYEGNNHYSGVPTRFSINGYGQDFTLIISGLEADDAAYYHCQQSDRFPYTFGQGTKLEITQREDATPLAFIFPPSKEQLKTKSATVVCLISSFYPSELNVAWKVDGKAATGDIQTSSATADTDKTYRLSSTLTLSTEQYNSHELYTCEVMHKTLSQPLVKSFKRSECSS